VEKRFVDMYDIELSDIKTVTPFIEKWHYSGTARSLKPKFVFALRRKHNGALVGTAVYGQPCGATVEKVYGKGTLELRRFCLIDQTRKNTESFFLGKTLRVLKKIKAAPGIISYADPNEGHEGIIYKATNFKQMPKTIGNGNYVVWYEGQKYHMRQVYQKRKGIYIPSAVKLQALIKCGKAVRVRQKPKLIYHYSLV